MTKKVTAYGGGLIDQGGRLRQGATLDDPSLPDLPGSARRWPRVSPLGLGKWVRSTSHLDELRAGTICLILQHPSQPGSAAGASVAAENYAALTRDTNR